MIGAVIDEHVSDYLEEGAKDRKSPPLAARLGRTEMALLMQMAQAHGTTRSDLARRLVVKGLLDLIEMGADVCK